MSDDLCWGSLTLRTCVIRGQQRRDNLYKILAACSRSNSFMETVSVVPTVSGQRRIAPCRTPTDASMTQGSVTVSRRPWQQTPLEQTDGMVRPPAPRPWQEVCKYSRPRLAGSLARTPRAEPGLVQFTKGLMKLILAQLTDCTDTGAGCLPVLTGSPYTEDGFVWTSHVSVPACVCLRQGAMIITGDCVFMTGVIRSTCICLYMTGVIMYR